MSKLRSINTHFWSDTYVLDLDPTEKLLFLYLLTNEQTNMLGIYELHIRRIAFDTGIDKDMVVKIFERFTKKDKAKYLDGYVILQNFIKHQRYNGNMQTSAINSWKELPLEVRKDDFCKPIEKGLLSFGMGSEPIAEIEDEVEDEVETINYVQYVKLWNQVNDCAVRITDNKREQIRARLRTYSEDELKESIRNRSKNDWINGEGLKYKSDWNSFWRNDEKPERYLKTENINTVLDGGTWNDTSV